MLAFLVKNKYDEAFRGVYFMRIREKSLSQACTRISRLVLEPKGLYFHTRAQPLKRENRGSVNRLRGHRS